MVSSPDASQGAQGAPDASQGGQSAHGASPGAQGASQGAPDGGWGWVVALGAALVQMQVPTLL